MIIKLKNKLQGCLLTFSANILSCFAKQQNLN